MQMHALVRAVQGDSGPNSPLLCSHLAATRGREQRSEVVSVAMASDRAHPNCRWPLRMGIQCEASHTQMFDFGRLPGQLRSAQLVKLRLLRHGVRGRSVRVSAGAGQRAWPAEGGAPALGQGMQGGAGRQGAGGRAVAQAQLARRPRHTGTRGTAGCMVLTPAQVTALCYAAHCSRFTCFCCLNCTKGSMRCCHAACKGCPTHEPHRGLPGPPGRCRRS